MDPAVTHGERRPRTAYREDARPVVTTAGRCCFWRSRMGQKARRGCLAQGLRTSLPAHLAQGLCKLLPAELHLDPRPAI